MDGHVTRGKFTPVVSAWATKVKLVVKDLNSWINMYRMTIAYWRVNKCIIPDAFPVPNIGGIKSRVGKSTLFTITDARGMYY